MIFYLHVLKLLKLFLGESLCDEVDVSMGLGHLRSGEIRGERVLVLDPTDRSFGMDESAMGEDDLLSFGKTFSSTTFNDSGFKLFLPDISPDE